MSNQVNTLLIEEAKELSEFWTGTMHQAILDNLIESNDLEALHEAVLKARQDASDVFDDFFGMSDEALDEAGDIY